MVETRGGRRFAATFFVAAFLVLLLGRWVKPVNDAALTAAAGEQDRPAHQGLKPSRMDTPHRVVIVGGGFGGLYTARHLGRSVDLVVDVGVAGLHRMLQHLDLLRSARAIVVVAGMDGALPGVVAGLVAAPVIAAAA